MRLINAVHAPVEEFIHGVLVKDPFRWLEDRDLPDTEEWISNQRQRFDAYFAGCSNLDELRSRVRKHLDVEAVDHPVRVANRYFYRRRNPGQEQASIYVRDIGSGCEKLLVNASTMDPFTSVGIYRISRDGSTLAFDLQHGGGDRRAIRILNVESGDTLSDEIETGYARGFEFTEDGRGFFYCHETCPLSEEHVVRLRLFHDTIDDQIVFRARRTPRSRLILIADAMHLGIIRLYQRPETSQLLEDFYIAQKNKPLIWKRVFGDQSLPLSPVLKHGKIFAITTDEAPNGKLIELDTQGRQIRTIVPEQHAILRQFVITKDRVYAVYLFNLTSSVLWWSLTSTDAGTIEVPPNGTVQLIGNQNEDQNDFFYTYESYVQPREIYEFFHAAGESRIWHSRFRQNRPAPCAVRTVSVASQDGTKVPMTLVSSQASQQESEHPVIMTGYGGFGAAISPQYSVLVSIMIDLGAVFALPQIRGGGEFGRNWHEAAKGRKRQKAFDDFMAAAEWLCLNGVTSNTKLGIFGGSNSGLLVCAAMTQRPDLFRAVLCIAPLLDMVRYERFDQAARWIDEYGSVASEKDFTALYAYSPYHRIDDLVDYPPVLFVSGDLDDRCNAAHVRKMAALLQERPNQTRPVLVDYASERGHAPVMPLSVRIEALVRRISFLCRELSIQMPSGGVHDTTDC